MYKSRKGNIELRIIGYEEPNNGRDLHIAELWIDEKNCSDNYFKNHWNRLNFKLDQLQFESPHSEHIFIPAEGNSFVLNTETFSITYIPYKGLSTIDFIKNEFVDDKIFIYYTDEVLEIKLN